MVKAVIRAVLGGLVAAVLASFVMGILTNPPGRRPRRIADEDDLSPSEQEFLLRELASQLDPTIDPHNR